MSALKAIRKAVKLAGGQSALARKLGVRQGNVWSWLNRSKRVDENYAIPVEKAVESKVTRYELRPDLYPIEEVSA